MIKKILPTLLTLAAIVTPTILFAKAPPTAEETILTQIPQEANIQEELSLMALYFTEAELQTVESPTRFPKPLTQIAENVTIITHKEIAKWNVHAFDEVIKRAAGVFVSFNGEDVNSSSTVHIQGSHFEQNLILVDGIKWNDMSNNFNDTNQIPVKIIDRIEIIKGPASSSWGSAFGGVINIITKDTGGTTKPTGDVFASYGEHNTREISSDIAGKAGPLGYYLYADNLDSDGIRDNRYIDNESLFGKFKLDLPRDIDLTLSLFHSKPDSQYGYVTSTSPYQATKDQGLQWSESIQFFNSGLDVPITDNINFFSSFAVYKEKYIDRRYTISTGAVGWLKTVNQKSYTSATRLSWSPENHNVVLGADMYRNTYQELETALVNELGHELSEENWAIYLNDTIKWGDLAITPGVRYDSLSISDNRTSPSLGVTYQLNDATLLRGLIARGFRSPIIENKQPDLRFYSVPNPDLQSEKVWTYQLGLESVAAQYFRSKATLFRHDTDDAMVMDDNWMWVNSLDTVRQGFELEIETIPFYDISVEANYTYVHTDHDYLDDQGSTCAANLIFKYSNPDLLSIYLAGNYVWWNDELSSPTGRHDTMTWDATVNKTIYEHNGFSADLFANVHNLFNGSQYYSQGSGYLNAPRWIEGGVKLHF